MKTEGRKSTNIWDRRNKFTDEERERARQDAKMKSLISGYMPERILQDTLLGMMTAQQVREAIGRKRLMDETKRRKR